MVVAIAVLVQMMANLNAVYSNFRRTLQPVKAGNDKDGPQNKIVINLLSQTQVKRWSYVYFALIMLCLTIAHIQEKKTLQATGSIALLATIAFIYCRSELALPIVGLEELVYATATGPLAMVPTSFFLVGTVPWQVVAYSHLIALFAWAFLIAQSAKDAPFARRMGKVSLSVALRLGFQLSYQVFLLTLALSYGIMFLFGLIMGHMGNLLLLATITQVKDMAEEFRNEQLHDLPDSVGRLAATLGCGLILSIVVSDLF